MRKKIWYFSSYVMLFFIFKRKVIFSTHLRIQRPFWEAHGGPAPPPSYNMRLSSVLRGSWRPCTPSLLLYETFFSLERLMAALHPLPPIIWDFLQFWEAHGGPSPPPSLMWDFLQFWEAHGGPAPPPSYYMRLSLVLINRKNRLYNAEFKKRKVKK